MEEKTQMEPEEVQLELLEIAKIDSNRTNSIKKNIQFIAWYLIISLALLLRYWIINWYKLNPDFFRAY